MHMYSTLYVFSVKQQSPIFVGYLCQQLLVGHVQRQLHGSLACAG